MRSSQQQRPDVAQERVRYAAAMPTLNAFDLVFIDEAGMEQGMRLSYGYAAQGARCIENAPFRTGRRTSLIGFAGIEGGRVLPVQGSVNAAVFEAFVRQCLVPTLRAGMVVVWDNARIHSREAVRLVESVGARVLFLPRYSPEYNAIEHFWSKVKHLVRKARADTVEALRTALDVAVDAVTPEDMRGWIEHCGYQFQPS